jgi:hypothetical protein
MQRLQHGIADRRCLQRIHTGQCNVHRIEVGQRRPDEDRLEVGIERATHPAHMLGQVPIHRERDQPERAPETFFRVSHGFIPPLRPKWALFTGTGRLPTG